MKKNLRAIIEKRFDAMHTARHNTQIAERTYEQALRICQNAIKRKDISDDENRRRTLPAISEPNELISPIEALSIFVKEQYYSTTKPTSNGTYHIQFEETQLYTHFLRTCIEWQEQYRTRAMKQHTYELIMRVPFEHIYDLLFKGKDLTS